MVLSSARFAVVYGHEWFWFDVKEWENAVEVVIRGKCDAYRLIYELRSSPYSEKLCLICGLGLFDIDNQRIDHFLDAVHSIIQCGELRYYEETMPDGGGVSCEDCPCRKYCESRVKAVNALRYVLPQHVLFSEEGEQAVKELEQLLAKHCMFYKELKKQQTLPDGGVEVDGCLHAEREFVCDEVDEYGDRYVITRCKQCGRYFRENEETGEVEILDHETLPDGGDPEDSVLLVLSALRRLLQDEVLSEHELELAPISELLPFENSRKPKKEV